MESNSIKGEARSIGAFYSMQTTVLQIPKYQRSYAWKKDHVEQWLDDIIYGIDNSGEYFIGPLIYKTGISGNNVNNYEILDGQQRLTTTFLVYFLMKKIYDKRVEKGGLSKDLCLEFDDNMPSTSFTKHSKRYVKISLNKHDDSYFRRLINGDDPPQKEKSHKNILDAYNQIEKWLEKQFNENGGVRRFLEIHYTLNDKFVFMAISVSNKVDAYKLFEAMNDKGLKLSQTDLVKNYIFSKCESNEDELHEYWSQIQENIKTSNYDFDVFMQYYWDGEYEEVRKNEVYKKFTEKFKTEEDVLSEVKELAAKSDYLDMFVNPKDYEPDHWSSTDTETRKEIYSIIDQIKSFGITQIHIIVIQLFKFASRGEKGEDQIKDMILPYLKEIRNFLFNYSVVCGRGSNRVLSRFGYAARFMNHNNDPDVSYFKKEMSGENRKLTDLNPSKDEFKTNFYTFKPESKASTEILKAIYPLPKGVNYDSCVVQLEHIIPNKWDTNKEWSDFLKKECDSYNTGKNDGEKKTLNSYVLNLLNRIGNHALLIDDDNKSASNNFYKHKYSIYEKNVFPDTNTIPKRYPIWNEESVTQRTKEILEAVIEKWNLFK